MRALRYHVLMSDDKDDLAPTDRSALYRAAVDDAKKRYLPIFRARDEKAQQVKAEQLKKLAEDKALCERLAPEIVARVRQVVAEKNQELAQLCTLEISEERHGYYKTDDSGNLLKDEDGQNIPGDDWLIGAMVYFVPLLSGSVSAMVERYRNTYSSSEKTARVSCEAPTQYEIEQANLMRSTAVLTIVVTRVGTVLVSLRVEATQKEKEDCGFIDKPYRVKSADFSEYYELNDLKEDFIGQQIERFIIVCLADSKIVNRKE